MKKYTLAEIWTVLKSCKGLGDVLNLRSGLQSMAEYYDPETFEFIWTLTGEAKMHYSQQNG